MQDRDFRCCLRYWLSIPLCEEGYCPVCGAPTDPFGDHYVMCKGLGDIIWRHDNLKEVIFSAARSAALAPRKEIPALVPGSNSRPADVYLPIWERGASAALDVTVISPLQKLTINQSAVTQGHAITVARTRKFAAHGEACRGAGVVFIPLVVESLGGWCKESASVIARIARLQGIVLIMTFRTPFIIYFNVSPSLYGSRTPLCGPIVQPSFHRQWMGSFDLIIVYEIHIVLYF